ncbi:Putative NADPH-quinone reductase (modulator of drug activity B) [Carnobacterium alterfunditum]|uniref:Putative NADPH-quinone reductase (Modulator of drug activity B) n=1 Tax=Carnobacterium alterfunditum TaxID=28230 RepID=A0A1N6FC56_9LACT|nr:NAD(P)H-dependent oxidoreductase [Carnobacterium alterfunditum]SIN92881.1 Putative NADPH-quinone reductase (modulator of drug activity B) [Carnobacterium alterfunditum]
MKTLVIISHPEMMESGSQQYLLSSIPEGKDITIHHLESVYPDFKLDVEMEQALLKEHERIIFQFPFYWYSAPALLKKWQDEVLTDGFAYGKRGKALTGKEFGLVMSIGVKEEEYQPGGREGFSIDELTKPFQAMALKTGMVFLKTLPIFQFSYLTEEQKMNLLIRYQQYLTREKEDSLKAREKWFIQELKSTDTSKLNDGDQFVLNQAIEFIEENRDTIDELKIVLDQME